MKYFTASIGILYLFGIPLYAQKADTSAKKAIASAVELYRISTEESQHLYNGPEYFIYDSRSKEHQFFESDEMEAGSVHYDGQFYPNVLIMYDIVKDEVAIEHLNRYDQIQLQKEKVSYFTVLNHHFIRLEKDNTGLRTGFYDLLYNKRLKVLARRIKERDEVIEQMKIVVEFPAKNFFYVYKDGVYHSVSRKSSVLQLFEDQKKALRKYIRENKLRFKKDRENTIVQVTAYYDQLTTP
ncbi:hypothetical protein [Xanthocytophaga agilis]|uniref:Uncharacterized protein n=1 Tax=Xanthocytophaga agilis TaxID=3048010 RepID=A0AAE3R1W6_9BACT|nr:hypothetical protein [Xanthocytophaga agilis]MDJ1499809.1 hypothetical protein [Xanthocytophaga agilis]